ncbi:DUF4411 family protein [Aminobacter sp. NyZ550]|nr:DUF4411 family protein [Aminobacter sp. NyZ550]WAX97904.1 DUF4411 family protein [Aminobacter sp. NyZ550]
MHLLDANVLIMANRHYYPLDRVPEFWDWLVHMGHAGHIKMPVEVVEEVRDGSDGLADWMSDHDHLDALQLNEDVEVSLVQRVINEGYAPDLDDKEIEIVGRDPFLIGAALRNPAERCVVTTEVSRPSRKRANRHVPDVCNTLSVRWMDSFGLIRTLNFSTSWKRGA